MKQVFWARRAKSSFFDIVNYLNENWTEKEYLNFEIRINEMISTITKHPFAYPAVYDDDRIRKAVLMKRISVFYRVSDDKISLLFFWNNSRNPVDLKF